MRESEQFSIWRLPVALALAGAVFPILLLLISSAPAATPPAVSGPARVIDGDTIDIGAIRVRLEGIDAPESAQTCQRATGETWHCGTAAVRALSGLVAGRHVDCQRAGQDTYGRMLGTCWVGGRDINAEMVSAGYAWAFIKYSRSYVAQEAAARSAKTGIWQGPAEPAWTYREKRWASTETSAPGGCAIKGNIARGQRIYHMPWNTWYRKVKIDASKGERWFCSEGEALKAGWRPVISR